MRELIATHKTLEKDRVLEKKGEEQDGFIWSYIIRPVRADTKNESNK